MLEKLKKFKVPRRNKENEGMEGRGEICRKLNVVSFPIRATESAAKGTHYLTGVIRIKIK